jgi:positive regulator of sigma E activity
MDSTLILFGLTYTVAVIALLFAIYSFLTLREVERELNDSKKRQTMSAWNYYHDKAEKVSKPSPFKNL